MAWELTFFQPGLCPLKQTDKKSHCSAHSQSCCFTPLLARINKNVGWKRDFLVAVEKPWPKCCTLEASNNLYWQQESKMENVVLIPPSLSLSCFLMHGYVFFFYTVRSQNAVMWLWVSHFSLTYSRGDRAEQEVTHVKMTKFTAFPQEKKTKTFGCAGSLSDWFV